MILCSQTFNDDDDPVPGAVLCSMCFANNVGMAYLPQNYKTVSQMVSHCTLFPFGTSSSSTKWVAKAIFYLGAERPAEEIKTRIDSGYKVVCMGFKEPKEITESESNLTVYSLQPLHKYYYCLHLIQGPAVHMIVRSLNRITQVVEKPSNLQLFVSLSLTERSLLCFTAAQTSGKVLKEN